MLLTVIILPCNYNHKFDIYFSLKSNVGSLDHKRSLAQHTISVLGYRSRDCKFKSYRRCDAFLIINCS